MSWCVPLFRVSYWSADIRSQRQTKRREEQKRVKADTSSRISSLSSFSFLMLLQLSLPLCWQPSPKRTARAFARKPTGRFFHLLLPSAIVARNFVDTIASFTLSLSLSLCTKQNNKETAQFPFWINSRLQLLLVACRWFQKRAVRLNPAGTR